MSKSISFLGTLGQRANTLPPTKSDWREVLPSVEDENENNILVYTIIRLFIAKCLEEITTFLVENVVSLPNYCSEAL